MNHSSRTITFTLEKRILLLIALIFLLWSAVFIYQTSFIGIDGRRYFCLFDDAMISMRYAWNFSQGHGLVWNAGERVQGYTNLLMTLVMSFATWMFDKSTAALSIQILGVGLMLSAAYATMKIAGLLFRDVKDRSHLGWMRILSFLFALAYYPLAYWSLTGMETGLLTVLLLFGLFFALAYGASGRPSDLFKGSFLLGLAFLTRNDSLIFALLIAIYLLWKIPHANRNYRTLVSASLLYVLFAAGQFLFQYIYYGELLPNTYVLKLTGMPIPDRISNGLGFIWPFLVQVTFLLLPVIYDVLRRFRKENVLLLSFVLAAIGYQIYVGGDPWRHWRMMSPTIPLLGILWIDLASNVIGLQKDGATLFKRYGPSAQLAVMILIGIVVINAYFLPEAVFLEKPFYTSANQRNVNIAIALGEVTRPDASLGLFWAGAIPYFAERRGIDFLGKSDRYIAHLPPDISGAFSTNGMKSPPGHNKYDLNYSIKELQPTYVQDFQWGTQDLSAWAETRYVNVIYKGVELSLLRGSPAVIWEKLSP